VADKPLPKPAWYKNTYFWIALILFIVGIFGLPFLGGDNAVRDPGQRRETGLAYLYFGAAVVMFVNGYISHSQTVQMYRESHPAEGEAKTEAKRDAVGATPETETT
jgi:hypothetical protein